MSDRNLNLIRTFAVVVGVVITLLTCGIGLGRVQSNVNHLATDVVEFKVVKENVSDLREDFAFMKGALLTEVRTQGESITRIEKAVNELTRAE